MNGYIFMTRFESADGTPGNFYGLVMADDEEGAKKLAIADSMDGEPGCKVTDVQTTVVSYDAVMTLAENYGIVDVVYKDESDDEKCDCPDCSTSKN